MEEALLLNSWFHFVRLEKISMVDAVEMQVIKIYLVTVGTFQWRIIYKYSIPMLKIWMFQNFRKWTISEWLREKQNGAVLLH